MSIPYSVLFLLYGLLLTACLIIAQLFDLSCRQFFFFSPLYPRLLLVPQMSQMTRPYALLAWGENAIGIERVLRKSASILSQARMGNNAPSASQQIDDTHDR